MGPFDTVIMYQKATTDLYRIGGSLVVILGTIGAALNLSVFGQKSMRKNPGAIYFIAFNIGNLFLLWFGLFPFVYRYLTNIDLSTINLTYCQFRTYLLNVLIPIPSSFIILASIDRTLVTSPNALTRQRSTKKLAFLSTIIMTLIWFGYFLPIWFYTHIHSLGPGFAFCFIDSGFYSEFSSVSTMTVTGFLPPALMIIFGWKTLQNFRRFRVLPTSSEPLPTSVSTKDRQLTTMLLCEIVITVIFSSVGSILYVYTQRTTWENKMIDQQALDYFLLDFGLCLIFIQSSLNFYSNIFVSKIFRKNVRKVLWFLIPPVCRRWINVEKFPMNSFNLTATAVGPNRSRVTVAIR